MRSIDSCICTSVADLQCDLQSMTDLDFLRRLLERCEAIGHKTRATLVRRRIRQIERKATP